MNKEIRNAGTFRANLVLLCVGCSIVWIIRKYTKKVKD